MRAGLFLIVCVVLVALLTACEDVATIPPLPTLTPSQFASHTPAVGELASPTAVTPTRTPTVTLTTVSTPTPLFAILPTLSIEELTAGPTQTARALPKPTIAYFKVFPTEAVPPGEVVTFFWSTTGATSGAIIRLKEDGTRGKSWAVSVPDGYLSVTTEGKEANEEYVLSVTNGISTVRKSLVVIIACDVAWFFSPPPAQGCPVSEISTGLASVQEFERGRMFWIAATNEIIVLFGDAQTGGSASNPAWLRMQNPFVDGMPEDDPSLVPPEGLRQPRRAFGLVWRTTPGVADRLGWATTDEAGYSMTWQSERGVDGIFYFSDPGSSVIALLPKQVGWQIVGVVGVATATPAP